MEEFAGLLSLTCIEIIVASYFLRPIVTLLLVLVVSLFALLTLGGETQCSTVRQLGEIVTLVLLYGFILGILQMIACFRRYYRELLTEVVGLE